MVVVVVANGNLLHWFFYPIYRDETRQRDEMMMMIDLKINGDDNKFQFNFNAIAFICICRFDFIFPKIQTKIWFGAVRWSV